MVDRLAIKERAFYKKKELEERRIERLTLNHNKNSGGAEQAKGKENKIGGSGHIFFADENS